MLGMINSTAVSKDVTRNAVLLCRDIANPFRAEVAQYNGFWQFMAIFRGSGGDEIDGTNATTGQPLNLALGHLDLKGCQKRTRGKL